VSEPDELRAADVDREFDAERLRAALNEGRLTLGEYDDRLRDTYAARTYGDLKGILADLPEVTPAARSQLMPSTLASPVPAGGPAASGHTRRWIAAVWSGWVTTALITVAIWAMTGAHYFWPGWVIGPWGAVLIATTINGLAAGAPRQQAEREARRDAEREARRRARDWEQ
jgi:hypothetical protein